MKDLILSLAESPWFAGSFALFMAAFMFGLIHWWRRRASASQDDAEFDPRAWGDTRPMAPMPMVPSEPWPRHGTKPAQDHGSCCGACAGSHCGSAGTQPKKHHSELHAALHRSAQDTVVAFQTRRAQVPPPNPGHVPPRPMPAPASARSARRRDDDDQPYTGSYYGQAVSQVMNSEPPAPTPAPAPADDSPSCGDVGAGI